MPDENVKADIIYICSPNNPTGAAYTRDQLKVWVDYARKNDAIIPTGVQPTGLTDMEANVYDLIAKRFISVFYPDCKFSTTTVLAKSSTKTDKNRRR